MAYDDATGTVVLFGGETAAGTYLNDTWTWDGTTWTEQFPAVRPSARVTAMTYDSLTQTVVLFGGADRTQYLGDYLDLERNHLDPAVSERGAGGAAPSMHGL
jgi:hypothetical protein